MPSFLRIWFHNMTETLLIFSVSSRSTEALAWLTMFTIKLMMVDSLSYTAFFSSILSQGGSRGLFAMYLENAIILFHINDISANITSFFVCVSIHKRACVYLFPNLSEFPLHFLHFAFPVTFPVAVKCQKWPICLLTVTNSTCATLYTASVSHITAVSGSVATTNS